MSLLDKVVKELDDGNLSLEDVFKKYKYGIELCNELNAFIKQLEGEIEHINSAAFKGD